MSGKLISEAAEAVILTLYAWKVIEGVGLPRETQVPNPGFSRAHRGKHIWTTGVDPVHWQTPGILEQIWI